MRTKALVHDLLRVAFATLAVVAITHQLTRLQEHSGFNPANFFSFFTIQSNILAATMLVVAKITVREGLDEPEPPSRQVVSTEAVLVAVSDSARP